MTAQSVTDQEGPLALICGGGSLPQGVAAAVAARGRRVVMFAIPGWAERETVEKYPHHWVHLGQLGRFFRLARQEGCRDVVFIGTLVRPAMTQLRLDWQGLKELPRALRAFRGGDDHLLSTFSRMLEDHGFHLVGAHDVAPEFLMPEGQLGRVSPDDRAREDIARALALLAATGPFDVGQAAVVADGHVIALEAAEGTDMMLARVVEMRHAGRVTSPPGVGVLVKAPKSTQDHRFDLPALGPKTIEGVASAQLAGVAMVAGAAIVANAERVKTLADAANLFVIGVAADARS